MVYRKSARKSGLLTIAGRRGDVAQVAQALGWPAVVVGGITIYGSNGSYGEARGCFRGRFGDELAQWLDGLDDRG